MATKPDIARFDRAGARLQRLAGAESAPLGARNTAEAEYAQAYQELVKAGTMPQLRAKYR